MANISSAYGTLYLNASTLRQCGKEFARFIGSFNNPDEVDFTKEYCVNDWRITGEQILEARQKKQDLLIRFAGCGRWTFEANIRNWGIADAIFDADINKRGRALADKIARKKLKIIMDFTDEEGGCMELYEMGVLIKGNGESIGYEELYWDEYDYTAENLVRLGFYDREEDTGIC